MIKEEKLTKLYDAVLAKETLTTKKLNEYGFTSKDLNDLIQEGIIERTKRGLYSLKSVEELFYYGKKLIAEKERDKASLCFERCFELDPTHLGSCFQLFCRSVQKEDYHRAIELYEYLLQFENEYYKRDGNYYIYLLNIITELPEKYQLYAKGLEFNDIKIPSTDKRYRDIRLHNQVRTCVLEGSFPHALKKFNQIIYNKAKLTVQDIIVKSLLLQAVNVESISKKTVVSLIKEKKYDEVVTYLSNKKDRHKLSKSEEYNLKLAKQFITIQSFSKVPQRTSSQAENIFEAIDTNNYDIALELCNEYNNRNNISNDNNATNLLLNDICVLINTLSKPKQAEEPKEENQKTVGTNIQPVITFSSIVSYLLQNDLDNAFLSLNSYMKSIGKDDYEFIIIDLIKISLLEKDLAFTKPMITLTQMSRENYSLDISNYIQDFYVTLSQNKFEEARIYLDIISKANKLDQDYIMTDNLYQALEKSEKILNHKLTDSISKPVAKVMDDNKEENINVATSISLPSPKQPKSKERQNVIIPEKRNSEKEFIAKKYKQLVRKKGIILLRPMDSDRIDRIIDMVKEYPNMVAFAIGKDDKQQVVLKYNKAIENVDVKNLIKQGEAAYSSGKYNECLKNFLQLLQTFDEPKPYIYAKLGLTYAKKNNIPLAIDYLTIATELSKQLNKANGKFDFTEKLLVLKGEISQEDTKPVFKVSQQDFNYNDVNNFYGIDNFNDINDYVCESGLDVESACHQLQIPSEKINLIKLIYAREFYMQGDFDRGDLLLKSFERSKDKTQETIKISNEIRKNKRFYQNRQTETSRKLVLSLIPKY